MSLPAGSKKLKDDLEVGRADRGEVTCGAGLSLAEVQIQNAESGRAELVKEPCVQELRLVEDPKMSRDDVFHVELGRAGQGTIRSRTEVC